MTSFLKKIKTYFQNKKKIKRLEMMINRSLEKRHLTLWEKSFLKDISKKDILSLSEKQVNKLEEIYDNFDLPRRRGYSVQEEDIFEEGTKSVPYCYKYGVSYDDVHDFDRD